MRHLQQRLDSDIGHGVNSEGEAFRSLKGMRILADCWLVYYDTCRSHFALRDRTPKLDGFPRRKEG